MNTHTRKTIGWILICTLVWSASCFLFIRDAAAANPFTLAGFYIDAAALASNVDEQRVELQTRIQQVIVRTPFGKVPVPVQITEPVLVDVSGNPYGRIAIGYDVQWSKQWATRFEVSHESSIATGRDRGAERVTLGVTWRPFAR